MNVLSRTIAVLVLASSCFPAVPALAAQRNSGPSVDDVCLIAYAMCQAACGINSPDSGLNFNEYITNQVCLRQCVDQLNKCVATSGDGSSSPARNFSPEKLVGPIFGMDDKPSGKSDKPANTTKPPADPEGGNGDDGSSKPSTASGGDLPLHN